MEPKKNIKKHKLVEPKWGRSMSQEEMISKLTYISEQIHRNTMNGPANWVIMGSHGAELLDEALSNYDGTNIEMGDFRVYDDTYVQDITIRPNPSVDNITIDFNVLPSGGVFYTGTTQEGNEPWRHL